jgi:hypothetical protein
VNLSEEQILTLAPDESSKKSGKDLANPSKWVTKGCNESALWGECQGSGSKPYQTQIDLKNLAFKCSCPSRKFPCKHGIGLALLYARQANQFSATEAPAWVVEWISKRAEKEEKKAEKKETIADEGAQLKRQQNREQKVADGIEELHLWIKDIIRNGIINIPEKGDQFWENTARRLVDAQAPGLAGMVRSLGQINYFQEGWQTKFLDSLLNIYIIIQAYKNKESLSASIVHEIKNWIGFTVNQEELKEQTGLMDTWLVVGKQVSQEDQLTVEKNWLCGMATGRSALVLQFLIRGQGSGSFSLTPGMYVQAELVFYPSAVPLRALIKRQVSTKSTAPVEWFNHWRQIAEAETKLFAQFPVRSARPYLIEQLTPIYFNQQWWLKDACQDLMPLKHEFKNIWRLLAISGGEPLNMALVGKENTYEPVGVWHEGTYKIV